MTTFREGADADASTSTTYSFAAGDTYLGNLHVRGDRDWYEITLEEGFTYEIRLEGDQTNGELRDPYLRLFDADGSFVRRDDDSGPGLDSYMQFTPTETATYYISAGGYADYYTGRYELSVESRPADLPADRFSDALMYAGGTFANELETGSDRDWIGVELFTDRTYQIDVGGDGSASELDDSFLRFRTGDGTFLRGNDNGGPDNDARVTWTTTETGLYFIDVLASNPADTGNYVVTVEDTGSDAEVGTAGADSMQAMNGTTTFYGLDGNDTLLAGTTAEAFHGGEGEDEVSFENATGRVMEDLQNDRFDFGDAVGNSYLSVEVFRAGGFADQLRGDADDNTFFGGGFSDRLYGRAGNDKLDGETGADALYGNAGADVLTGGGDPMQRDRFIYFQNSDSGVGRENRDVITDFVTGVDRIEIGRLDADTTRGGNQDFDWIGRTGFSGTPGELRYFNSAQGNTIIQADTDGDGASDFEIELTGTMDLAVTDFLI
ncbi:calcium-binding protein [Pseudaestuariivita atlantica]|nr:M10 family metallopeptidase C-terminal domain-containing protein [Pseudaestuariivita atlantica]